MNDEFLDPAEERHKRREAKAFKARQAQDDAVIQSLMAAPGGRAWMHYYLDFCTIFHTSFDPNPYVMAYNEGRRNVGLRLLADIMRACPEYYIQMMSEHSKVEPTLDRHDIDDERNYDEAGRWIGLGEIE